MTTAAAVTEPTGKILYPLLKRAQDFGVQFLVGEVDSDGDFRLTVNANDGAAIDDEFVWENDPLPLKYQYVIMGILMDWLSLLQREVDCVGIPEAQQAMGRAWATGGFVAMLETFIDQVQNRRINACAVLLKEKRETQAEAERAAAEPTPEQLRIKELEAKVNLLQQRGKTLQAVELVTLNEVTSFGETPDFIQIVLRKRFLGPASLSRFIDDRG